MIAETGSIETQTQPPIGTPGRPPRIAIIGDVMLDIDRIGRPSRLVPDSVAPVLVDVQTVYRPGGAGNVAVECRKQGAEVLLFGVVGEDLAANKLKSDFERWGIKSVYVAGLRPTIVKERIIARGAGRPQQVVARIDTESTKPIDECLHRWICYDLEKFSPDIVLICDHAKGVVSRSLICRIALSIISPIIVDPAKDRDWATHYGAVSGFVANREECTNPSSNNPYWLVHKLDADGATLYETGSRFHFPSLMTNMDDVCGAGDRLLAGLAVALGLGASLTTAVQKGMHAAARIPAVTTTAAQR